MNCVWWLAKLHETAWKRWRPRGHPRAKLNQESMTQANNMNAPHNVQRATGLIVGDETKQLKPALAS